MCVIFQHLPIMKWAQAFNVAAILEIGEQQASLDSISNNSNEGEETEAENESFGGSIPQRFQFFKEMFFTVQIYLKVYELNKKQLFTHAKCIHLPTQSLQLSPLSV
jgi:hypothetical protein